MAYHRIPPLDIPTDPHQIGYLAAMVDAEGWIGIDTVPGGKRAMSPAHRLRVVISNTSPELMTWLKQAVGGGRVEGVTRNRVTAKPPWRPAYAWVVGGSQAEILLRAIEPYLVVKRRQAGLALAYRAIPRGPWARRLDPTVATKREAFKRQIQALNRRGVTEAPRVL